MTPGERANGGDARRAHIGIVGAGFGGLGLGIKLREAGVEDFVIWERDSEVGGTWWANSYPGCQCDVPSHLYSFSFALNPDWSNTYSPQPEIFEYLRDCADRFGLRRHIHLRCAARDAAWQERDGVWRVETDEGPWEVDILVAAPGGLSEPRIPDIPGLDTFTGTTFHTAAWNHDHDLAGRRVAVVGTGASAIQVVPSIQPKVEQLTVFQRTPPWVVPHSARPTTPLERELYRRVPGLQRAVRAGIYLGREALVPGLVYNPKLLTVLEAIARRHIANGLSDPELRRKVTPDYRIGCKRILPSNNWYPALDQPNVELIASGLEEVRPGAVVGAGGEAREVDTIIFATGFHVTDIPIAEHVRGAGGALLSEVWNGSPECHRGTNVAGFPNFFLLGGPNTGLGHTSIVFMLEAQIHYVMLALEAMRRRGATRIDVRPEAQAAYNRHLQKRLAGTVWNTGGCRSWYLDANGRNSTIWPDFTWRFWYRMREFREHEYVLSTTPVPEPEPAAPVPA
jgi:cation diffusion facilitator CzcD-associated flavoprotein CzcO